MANEISLTIQLRVQNPAGSTLGYQQNITQQRQITQSALGANAEIVAVPTTATTYTFPSLTTYGILYLQNLDATNFITFGADNGGTYVPLGKLKAGEIALLRLDPGITFQMQADTAAVEINYLLLED